MSEKIAIGRIRTSHGVHGFMKVFSYSGEVDHFRQLKTVLLKNENRQIELSVEQVQISGQTLLVKFNGVDNPEAAKKYSGWDILVNREYAAPLDDDEFYYSDLVHCIVECNGEESGKVIHLLEGGPGLLLEIEKGNGEKRIVPFQKEFIGQVDVKKKRIEVLEGGVLE